MRGFIYIMSRYKIPATRFVCSEDGKLDYIELRLDRKLLESIDDPKFREYNSKFTPVTFVKFRMTIKNGYLPDDVGECPTTTLFYLNE